MRSLCCNRPFRVILTPGSPLDGIRPLLSPRQHEPITRRARCCFRGSAAFRPNLLRRPAASRILTGRSRRPRARGSPGPRRLRCQALGGELLGQKREHRALQGASVVVGVGGVGEVVFLDGVEGEVVELVLVGFGPGDGVRVPTVKSLVTLTRNGPELGVVVVAGELDEMLLAIHVDLGDDGLQVVGLLDGRVAVQASGDASERTARSARCPR